MATGIVITSEPPLGCLHCVICNSQQFLFFFIQTLHTDSQYIECVHLLFLCSLIYFLIFFYVVLRHFFTPTTHRFTSATLMECLSGSSTRPAFAKVTQITKYDKIQHISELIASIYIFQLTLYTVPKAPEPMMPPRLISDSLISLSFERSGFALVGVSG